MPTKPAPKNARRSKLTQERVLAAALRIADKEGLEALSMRRLAQSLRVEAMSLYNHFANKEAILDRLVEYVTGKVQVPLVGTPWRTAMRMRAISARTVFREHPWAAALSESRSTAGAMGLRLCNAVLAVLSDAGFFLDLAQSAFLTLDSYIYGFALQEASWPIRPEQRQQAIEAFLQVTKLDDFEHVAAAAQSARKSKESGATFYDRQFDFGLELILDGLERARKRTAP